MSGPPPIDPLKQAADDFLAAQAREAWAKLTALDCRKCPCARSRVLWTWARNGLRFRRRECIECRTRFTSVELRRV